MSNTIHMQARLGKEPELRDVGETKVCRLWVAESESYKNKAGEKVEHTNWWSAEVWGRRGEVVAEYFKKGDGIVLRGSLRITEKDEKKYYSIRVDDWEFPMSRKGDGDSSGSYSNTPGSVDDGGNDIPF